MLRIEGRRESSFTTLLTPPPYQRKAGLFMRRTIPLLATMALTLLVASGLALAAGVGSAAAESSVVGPGESIQKAINAADPGDTIVVRGVHRRGRGDPQGRHQAARRRRRDRSARQGRLALLQGFRTGGYLRLGRRELRYLRGQRRA